jgi:hypothetical protein
MLKRLSPIASLNPELAEMGDVEDSHGIANRFVLRDHAGVLERHVPAREFGQLGP